MIWARKSLVHFLAVLLFVTLLGLAAAVNFNLNLAHPDKLKGWLAESKIYDNVVSSLLDKAQTDNNTSATVPFR